MNITIIIYTFCIALAVLGMFLMKYDNRNRWQRVTSNTIETNARHFIEQMKAWKLIKKIKNEKKDKEIYEAIAFLRNMTAIGKGSSVSSDFVIQQLANHKGILQKTYIKMLSYLRLNRKEEAALIFYEMVGTPMGKDFARLLIQWDEMDPSGLTEILLSHQKNIKEVRMTIQKRRDEMISDLIYFPVVMNVILIFINFIYVAYFLDQKEILQIFL